MVIDQRYCTSCHVKDNLIKYSNYKNKELGILYQYYLCNDCNNKRSKINYKANKSSYVAANNKWALKKRVERYEIDVLPYGKPTNWVEMNNHQKAKYIRDQRERLSA